MKQVHIRVEDEYVRLVEGHYRNCPYYRDGDCYKIARKQ